jgi:3-dehydroquinate synthase
MAQKIIIENGAAKSIPKKIRNLGANFTIITDSNLQYMAEQLTALMKTEVLKCNSLVLPAGEQTKTLQFIERAAKSLIKMKMKRDSCLIALGGGVIGDFTGFLASIFMRGIPFVAVPTTLLAMCDSAIGSKTGVDLDEGKNLIGTFYASEMVIMDPLLLREMPEKSFRGGMAEVIKHGIIKDAAFFKFLEKNATAILARRPEILKKMISKSVKIKQSVVKSDPKEAINPAKDSRMLLNYGHTFGHAIEKLSNFTLPHGDAIAIGMVAENRLAVGKKLLKQLEADRIKRLIKRFNLPTKIPTGFESNAIKRAMELDKKNIGGKLLFALPTKIGHARIFEL